MLPLTFPFPPTDTHPLWPFSFLFFVSFLFLEFHFIESKVRRELAEAPNLGSVDIEEDGDGAESSADETQE